MYVAEKVAYWSKEQNLGLVVGATHPEQLADIRQVAGDMPILIPGVGAQGGDLEKAVRYGTDNFRHPALINVSRSVLYASAESDFAEAARAEAEKLNSFINNLRSQNNRDES
jgi:orotidine-5'-phosphate decarboxylase